MACGHVAECNQRCIKATAFTVVMAADITLVFGL